MPKRSDIKKVLIIGSGPIQIGQACEFDYSGTQAVRALKKEGLEVILVNSNPATIMTDPELADKVYIEPLTISYLEKIIEKEKPDSVIPTLGGQTALNLALELNEAGILKKYNVKMLGVTPEVIRRAEDREIFRSILDQVGARYPKSVMVTSLDHGVRAGEEIGFPIILRPNYTLGGGGGGIAYNSDEYLSLLQMALQESPTSQVLVEESILGWKEFELEVVRDKAGTFLVVCSIENFDPCGVHTGDSITVAPQQTLSDKEYQDMRDEARKIVDAVGVETGGANIQFATHPQTGERVVIEMNPRVSRSSALASKATGFPIAKLAALLAIGYELEELKNDITGNTPACFEPALDYVVTKIPRFAFEKFGVSNDTLTTQMKSVGEVMAIGRTFKESLQKALTSLEAHSGDSFYPVKLSKQLLATPNSKRIYHLAQALREGMSILEVEELTSIHPWFLEQIQEIIEFEIKWTQNKKLDQETLIRAKKMGFSDVSIARICNKSEKEIRQLRWDYGLHPAYLPVDTCAGEFAAHTPYYYSTYWASSTWSSTQAQAKPLIKSKEPSVVIIGSGANRIGQGIEFDYSCVRAVQGFQKSGYSVAMINSNPETVSTDYDIPNQLFFEPLTIEYVAEVMHATQPMGFVSQYGGQTAIHLSEPLVDAGFQILGSSLDAIDLAEDRERFVKLCKELDFAIPKSFIARTVDETHRYVQQIGYPVIVRPSYVIGGSRMEVMESDEDLTSYFEKYGDFVNQKNPLLIDEFLDHALEVDVDMVCNQNEVLIGGVVEHIEAAGVHSGDSMGVIPPQRLKPQSLKSIEEMSVALAKKMQVRGHLNLQIAIKNNVVYMLEANPRCSRSVPFICKSTGIPLVDLGVKAILNQPFDKKYEWKKLPYVSVKGVVFPFKKMREADSLLGPEMKSTGESMGVGKNYAEALLKAFIGSHVRPIKTGTVFLSIRERDKEKLTSVARELKQMGFHLVATSGTATYYTERGISCDSIMKVSQGRPHCVDAIRSGEIAMVINTASGRQAIIDSFSIRRSCVDFSIPCITESHAAEAFVTALRHHSESDQNVYSILKPL